MKRLFIYSILLFSIIFSYLGSYSQTYKWVRGGGSTSVLTTAPKQESVYSMCTDDNGNVYSLSVVGYTAITADTFYMPSAGSSQNILFTSHNCNGQMRFAKFITGTQAIPYGVTCDIFGHVYIAFMGLHTSLPLKIGYDTTITGDMYRCQALAQFDTTGHYNWVRFVGPNLLSTFAGAIGGNSFVAVDNANNVHFINSMKYGVQITPTITSHWGTYDLMYDVAGNLLTVNKLDIDSSLEVYGAIIDKQSNKMYIHGYRNTGMFPDSSLYSYIAALDVSRNRIWIDTLTNPYYPNGAFNGITADGFGHIYGVVVSGRAFVYKGDTSRNILTTGSSPVSAILKLDTAGNLLRKRVYHSSLPAGFASITLLPNNKLAAYGTLSGKVVSGTDTVIVYPGEGQNALMTIVDTACYVHALQQFHGVGFYDGGNACTSDRVGNLYIGGKIESNVWAGILSPYTSVGGDSDYFIMKYGIDCSCTAMPVANYTYTGTDLTRSFTYTGTMTGIDSVRWNFGDGGTSTTTSPTHTYAMASTYTVCVRVYSSCGNDMRCQAINIACANPVTSAFVDTGILAHGFTYTGSMAEYDSVVWDFGDGFMDTGLIVHHTFAVEDTYHVCATVYTRCGTHTYCKDLFLGVPGLVSATSFANVSVFPNPATEELYLSGISQQGNYRLISVVGAIIQSGTLHAGTNVLQMQQQPPGIYVLEMSAPDGQKKVVRIVKQ